MRFIAVGLFCLVVAGCETPPPPAPSNSDGSVVEWSEALRILNKGNVVLAGQTHDLYVTLHLKDGTIIYTTEPSIDAIIFEINKCARCGDIPLVTE